MSSLEEDKRLNSVNYLLQSCALVKALGGRRVIFHAGSCGKQSREAALEKALDTMRRAVQAVDEAGYGDCILCPETMGKVNQLGTLDEVLALCSVDERMIPCVDFGHLYARSQGTELNDETAPADYAAILDAIAAALPGERAKKFHAHFSRIALRRSIRSFCSSWLPCEKLKRATFMPPCINFSKTSSESVAGPIVHIIFVFRINNLLSPSAFYHSLS